VDPAIFGNGNTFPQMYDTLGRLIFISGSRSSKSGSNDGEPARRFLLSPADADEHQNLCHATLSEMSSG
jgi:hypothetical protein